jgi:uncharacterized iron-regulated protein
MMRRMLFIAWLLASLGTNCVLARDGSGDIAPPSLPDLTSYAFVRAGNNSVPVVLTLDQAANTLNEYDVVLLGEWHDHAGNHLAEMALLRALHERAPQLALSMEMFERDVQPILDDYLAGRIGEEALRERGRAWPNYAESYRPLVEFAKESGFPVIAANAPASVVRCVGQQGPEFLARMPVEKRGWAAAELHLADGPYKDKFMRFLAENGDHGQGPVFDASGAPTPGSLRSFAAQVTRDDTMAESMAQYISTNPGAKIVHVTGAFHVEAFLGTAERLKLRAPTLRIAVVVPSEADQIGAMRANREATLAILLHSLPKDYVSEDERKAARGSLPTIRARPCAL